MLSPSESTVNMSTAQTDRQTDGRQTVTLRFQLDAANVKTARHFKLVNVHTTYTRANKKIGNQGSSHSRFTLQS